MATRWHPDTCACVVEYDGDGLHPVSIVKCEKHAGATTAEQHLELLHGHNRKKNHFRNELAKRLGNEDVYVNYDQNDNLVVKGHRLKKSQLQQIVSEISPEGADKVVFDSEE